MKIDASKVNLTERDIEDWLYDNPNAIFLYYAPVERWTHRQLRLPSGILDLLGVVPTSYGGRLVIVELKNTPIKSEHLTQVSRYAFDVSSVVDRIAPPGARWAIDKVVLGTSCDTQVMREAESLDIHIMVFVPHVNVEISSLYWNDLFRKERDEQYNFLVGDAELVEFSRMLSDKADDFDVVGEFEEAIRNATQGSAL